MGSVVYWGRTSSQVISGDGPLWPLALVLTLKVKKPRFPESTGFLQQASYQEQELMLKLLSFCPFYCSLTYPSVATSHSPCRTLLVLSAVRRNCAYVLLHQLSWFSIPDRVPCMSFSPSRPGVLEDQGTQRSLLTSASGTGMTQAFF